MPPSTVDVPVAIGTGLLAMDVVLAGGPPAVAAGGTCGNVMAILAWLGWAAMPVARLNGDAAAHVVRGDLARFGVRLDLAEQSPSRPTPVIIERLRTGPDGTGMHRFSLTCPSCRAWLPQFQPVPSQAVRRLVQEMPTPQAFFFDRVSRGALLLAERAVAAGALVWFEPSRLDDDALSREAVAAADVLKYSRDRLPHFAHRTSAVPLPLLEIETRGADGVAYRGRGLRDGARWRSMPAVSAFTVVDPAGAGDWFSAMLIREVGTGGRAELEQRLREPAPNLTDAVRRAQAASAVACGYPGARGAMYTLGAQDFLGLVEDRLAERPASSSTPVPAAPSVPGTSFCKSCGTPVESWA